MIKSDTIGKVTEALAKAQNEFSPVLKQKDNPFFKSKYADLSAVIEATQPFLVKNGLVIIQFPVNLDARIGVLSILAHTSGEFIGQEYTLPISKQDAQTGIAGVTYARRAARLAIIDVAAEDDDGNTAAGRKEQPAAEPEVKTYNRNALSVAADDVVQAALAVTSGGEHIKYINANPPSPIPNPEQLDAFTTRLKALREKLQTEGNLKPSPGLSAPRKILNYVLKVTGAEDLKQISVIQFDAFFAYAEKMDPVALVKLINQGGK